MSVHETPIAADAAGSAPDPWLRPSRSAWFRSLPDELRERILELVRPVTFDEGQLIIPQGQTSPGLLAIVDGQVEVCHWLTEDSEVLVDLAGPGRWLGLDGVLGGATTTSLGARTAVKAWLLPRRACDRLLAEKPRFLAPLVEALVEESADLRARVAEALSLSPDARLRRLLARLAERERREHPSSLPVALTITQLDLAALVGLSRQTVNRLLQRLADEGLVTLSFCRITISDPKSLL